LVKKAIEDFNSTGSGRAIYIDCLLYQTTNAIFHEILLSLNSVVSSKSNYDLTKRLKARIRHLDSKIIICLDHFENLKEIETINRILSLELGLIMVSESEDAYRSLNPVAKASITNLIEIPSYAVDQTLDILLERAEQALEKYSYSEDKIRKIAEMSKGNITLALNLLKSLALKAENEGKDSIDDVELGYEIDCPDGMLNRDKTVILKILKEWKSLPSSRLYDFYTEKARHPKGRRSFRNYMNDLCTRGFVRNIGEKRGRVYEIVEQEEVIK
jgi:Cdc6-like AAA superfamily ATPase